MDPPRLDGHDDSMGEREHRLAALLDERKVQEGYNPSPGKPKDFVCVDGSEGGDNTARWAMNNLPQHHRLVFVHGVYAPFLGWKSEELKLEQERMQKRYKPMCEANGRECSFFTFPYLTTGDLGTIVCAFARYNGVKNVITGRRSKISGLTRQFLGSGSQSIVNNCAEVPVTTVSDVAQTGAYER